MKVVFHAAAIAAVLGIANPASAQVIVNENFDGYANQAAFEAAWVPIGTVAPNSATLSSTQFVSGTNSIEILGTATNSQQRNRLSFAESGTVTPATQIVFRFDFYDSSSTASPYRQFTTLQDTTAPSATNQLISLGLSNNQTIANSGGNYYMARILGYTVPTTADPDGGPTESVGGAGAFFKLNDFGVGLRTTGWNNLKVVISSDDGLSTDYAFYVNDQLAEVVSNVGTTASLRSFDNIALGSGFSNANNTVYYDNINLTIVPEPTTFALGLGAVFFLIHRRKAAAVV